MSDKSNIEWTDATWNPVRGCSRVSEGCRNCYAEKVAHRFSGPGLPYEGLTVLGSDGPRWNGKIMPVREHLMDPLKWKRPRRIFVNSMSDLFHENIPTSYRDEIFGVMALAKHHIFQVLTKRPQQMYDYFKNWSHTGNEIVVHPEYPTLYASTNDVNESGYFKFPWPLSNVWLGVSVEDQKTADERIPLLLQTPAAVRWISAEPLLGPISLTPGLVNYLRGSRPEHNPSCDGNCVNCPIEVQTNKLDWVVVGGESGANARAMKPDWVRMLLSQCVEADVPLYFKQWGSWSPITTSDGRQLLPFADYNVESKFGFKNIGKKNAGRLLDGVEYSQFPEVANAQ